MKFLNKLMKKKEPVVDNVEAETVDAISTDKDKTPVDKTVPQVPTPQSVEQEQLQKEMFGGVYSVNSFAANPVLIETMLANLLFDVRAELRKLNATFEKTEEEIK